MAFTGNLTAGKITAVRQGYGYAIVVDRTDRVWDPACIVSRPLFPPLTTGLALAWKRGQPFSAVTEKFIDHIRCFSGMDQPSETSI